MNILLKSLLFFLLLSFLPLSGYAQATTAIPTPLAPWVDWVLHDHEEELLCAPSYQDAASLHCDWPTRLMLTVDEKGGFFRQQWLIQHERWAPLPGDTDHWPQMVKVNGQEALVMNRNGVPVIKLTAKGGAASHEISGSFAWETLPESLKVPAHSGLIALTVRGQDEAFPRFDGGEGVNPLGERPEMGVLWLQASSQTLEKVENILSLQVYRLIDDTIPAQVVTMLKLDSAGAAREVTLGPLFDPGQQTPLAVTGDLPSRLEADGRIRVQVRPGQWNLRVTTRLHTPLTAYLWTRPADPFWPKEEIISFHSQPELRAVEISGVFAVDPQQTSLPAEWRTYPAYRIADGETMHLKETRRGAPTPAPDQLHLQRNFWLRFDGSGYTIQDSISGQKNNGWRLEMAAPIELGRVTVNNREQFITKQAGSNKAGIELREGQVHLLAESACPSRFSALSSTLPVAGWDHDFQQVNATLNLPPGWKLLHATGIDAVTGTWTHRWSLLDFFVVIIFTLAVYNLYKKKLLTVIAFVSFVISYHEPEAPHWIWLAILLGVALLRHLPEGKFRQLVKGYQAVVFLILALIAIPFAISQLRTGIYPQLEKPWLAMHSLEEREQQSVRRQAQAPAPMAAGQLSADSDKMVEMTGEPLPTPEMEASMIEGDGSPAVPQEAYKKMKNAVVSASPSASVQKSVVPQYDPKMIQQTGPGLPAWQWNTVALNWSGPVQRDQQIQLTLIGPTTNLVLAVLRVALMVLLVLGILQIHWRSGTGWSWPNWRGRLLGLLLLAGGMMAMPMAPSWCQAAEIPSPEMFEQLRARLLEKDSCFPACAAVADMGVVITPENLTINLVVDSQIDTAVPLPGNSDHWLPQQVFRDDKPAGGLFREGRQLWILMPAGRHLVRLQGKVPAHNTLQLPLALHPAHIQTEMQGWTVEGINDGVAESQLQFKRITENDGTTAQILESGILPPFVRIERTLLLGLSWKVETRVIRTSPLGAAVVLSVPLLPGESVLSEGVRVEEGRAKISLEAQASELRWESVLEKEKLQEVSKGENIYSLRLTHAKNTESAPWTEIWRVDISPIFHLETEGIPVILHNQGLRWYPTWHPWPGEEVRLLISRPGGIDGQTLTIEKSQLQVRPGKRVSDSSLSLSIRSSQGGQHAITLPAAAQLQKAVINGAVQQVRQEQGKIILPIQPGKQNILLEWREPVGLGTIWRTPALDLGISSVNAAIEVSLPKDRWPLLLGGPRLGPAILYWSVLLVLVIVAFAVGKSRLTPLCFYQLFLLGIGMSMGALPACLLVLGWLVALHFRQKMGAEKTGNSFNLMQFSLGLLTVLALIALVWAISQGLLGHPDMNIVGNGSNSSSLRWYQDASGPHLPQAWMVSIPMLAYRLAMLAWALWISFTLLKLLKWGWRIVSEPRLWDSAPRKKAEKMDITGGDKNK